MHQGRAFYMNNDMKKVAILASGNLLPGHPDLRTDAFELEEEIGKLRPTFAAYGMKLDVLNWRDAPEVADQYDAMLPLLVWDYFESNQAEFLKAMAQICQKTELFNRFDIIKWNSNKSYLEDLASQGVQTIPSRRVDRISETEVQRSFEKYNCDKLVIKPDVGGGAWRQVLLGRDDPYPSKDLLPPAGTLIQPFLKSVLTEGEFSFLYFGGAFSHGLVKRPKDGDYRVQSTYGGREEIYEPTKQEREQARAVFDMLDFTPLYARVDLLRADDGRLLLIELELIEPYLYLDFAGGAGADNKGAQRLAKVLAKKLGI